MCLLVYANHLRAQRLASKVSQFVNAAGFAALKCPCCDLESSTVLLTSGVLLIGGAAGGGYSQVIPMEEVLWLFIGNFAKFPKHELHCINMWCFLVHF